MIKIGLCIQDYAGASASVGGGGTAVTLCKLKNMHNWQHTNQIGMYVSWTEGTCRNSCRKVEEKSRGNTTKFENLKKLYTSYRDRGGVDGTILNI